MTQGIYLTAAFLVLACALCQLEHADPMAKGLTARQRANAWLWAVGWFVIAVAAGGELARPVICSLGIDQGLLSGLIEDQAITGRALMGGLSLLVLHHTVNKP